MQKYVKILFWEFYIILNDTSTAFYIERDDNKLYLHVYINIFLFPPFLQVSRKIELFISIKTEYNNNA